MRAALGCITLALCALQLPHGRALPHGRSPKHREPPDRRLPPAILRLPHRHPPSPHGEPPQGLQSNLRLKQLIIPRPQPALWHGPKPSPRHRHRHPPGQRGRRHIGARLHRAQPLRVGCVLGTCQVQNLSHRLWQLMGRPGRQDSSPMNPNSPHSYG
ncbi:protein ADM2 [Lagopus muta]|uniref:protein ADM2 n=1 Tax=Lagopus muta TaxID=64668 RepID=UPI0020A043C8|nr:protein ADM2 [Lagopus muta]XP_048782264.1 protein ADM2 [Lagopus muta]